MRQRLLSLEAGLDLLREGDPLLKDAKEGLSREPENLLDGMDPGLRGFLPEIYRALPLESLLGEGS